MKSTDFMVTKDDMKFRTFTGCAVACIGIVYLNIIILNLVISLVGDTFDNSMMSRKEIKLNTLANMLSECYALLAFVDCCIFCKQDKVIGHIFVLREEE